MKFTVPPAGLLASLALSSVLAAAPGAEPPRPNIILAMADDLGWGDVGFDGNPVIKTPQLDRMAAASLRFTRFYSAAPVCSPTRGGCLTGRHPYRYGIWTANQGHLRKEEISIADALKTQGYLTGHFGKWHLGTLSHGADGRRGGTADSDPNDYQPPWEHGFETCFSTEQAVPTWNPMQNQPFPTKYWTGPGQAATDNLEGDDSRVIMDRAVAFIDQAAAEKKPFLAVIWFHAPHEPVVAGPEFRKMYASRDPGEQNYYGAITALDVQMGRLRQELRTAGVAGNTLLWFASDNGPEGDTGDRGTTRGTAGPFRGRKRSLWEGGIHVPGLLEWPGRIAPGVTDVACSTLDYFPTTLALLGFKMKGQPEPIDGINLLPLFAGGMSQRPVPIPFVTLGGTGTKTSRGSPRMALVDNRYKLLTDLDSHADHDLLYDLIADPGETTNLIGQHPAIAAAMKEKLVQFQVSYKRSLAGKDYSTPFVPGKWDIPPDEPGFMRQQVRAGALGWIAPPRSPIVEQDEDSGMIALTAGASAASATPSWNFMVYQPGRFDIELTGDPDSAAVYEISVGGQTIRSVPGSARRIVGSVELSRTGEGTLGITRIGPGNPNSLPWSLNLIPESNEHGFGAHGI